MRRPENQPLRYRLALALGLAMLFAAAARAEDKPTCTAGTFGAGQVQAVLDGRTVRLSDGRTIRLAGIKFPSRTKPIVGRTTPRPRGGIWCS
jgi:endonuclease YncB( thermonuclease family)